MIDYTIPEWEKSALLTVDVQRDFTEPGGAMCIPGTLEAVPAMARLAAAYRAAHLPIVHIVRLYLPDGSNVDLCRRGQIESGVRMAVPGSEGSQVVSALLPQETVLLDTPLLLTGRPQPIGPREWILYKPRWGAFHNTGLEEHLRAMDINTVVVCGCNFPNCPRATMYGASERDFRVVCVSDAISGAYELGLAELSRMGIRVLTSGECVRLVKDSQTSETDHQ